MAHGLQDFYSHMEAALTKAINLTSGLDAAKSVSPTVGDVYVATNTAILYICFAAGTWTNAGSLYLLLAGGTISGDIAMGTKKITGLGDPTAAQDAATRAYVLAQIATLWISAVASDNLKFSNDTIKQTSSNGYTKLKETKLTAIFTGAKTIRIKFDLRCAPAGKAAYGKIYRNDVAIGTERSNDTVDWVTFSEDFDASAWVDGDLIQVYAHATTSEVAQVQNFRFYYDISFPMTNQDPA